MVKSIYQKLGIDIWVVNQKIGLTRPSLCVYHNAPGIGGELLDALCERKDSACPARLTLTFAECSRKNLIEVLKLLFVPASDELKVLNVRCDERVATIQMTNLGLPLVMRAFSSWLKGHEDFGVAPRHSLLKASEFGPLDLESGEVWFWGPGYAGP